MLDVYLLGFNYLDNRTELIWGIFLFLYVFGFKVKLIDGSKSNPSLF